MVNVEAGVGLELIERQAAVILFENLNAEIDRIQPLWDDRDKEWQRLTGNGPDQVNVEHIEEQNFYYGHRPSLIEAPPKENYPNISVMCHRGNPPGADKIDQGQDFKVELDIEIMVKADDQEAEAVVNRRCKRTIEAVNQVLTRNSRLNGLSLGFDDDPIVIQTDVFKRAEESGAGPDWYWQASRIRYTLTRHSNLPEVV